LIFEWAQQRRALITSASPVAVVLLSSDVRK
jgi:hypothetical protein